MTERIQTEEKLTLYEIEEGLVEALDRAEEAERLMQYWSAALSQLKGETSAEPGEDEYENVANARDNLENAKEDLRIAKMIVEGYLQASADKRDRVAQFLVHCESQAALAAEEIKRLQARKSSFESKADRLKGYVRFTMEAAGVKDLKGNTATLKLRKLPDYVVIEDLDQIPNDYKRRVPESWNPDKPAIKAAIKAGYKIPGADLAIGQNKVIVK